MNWLDLGILIFALILIIIGAKRGFMTSVINHFSAFINILLSIFLYKPIGNLLEKWFGMSTAITNHYSNKLLESSADFGVNLLTVPQESLHDFVSTTMDASGIKKVPRFFYNIFMNNSSLYIRCYQIRLSVCLFLCPYQIPPLFISYPKIL